MVSEAHDVYEKMKAGFVETSSGTKFNLDEPEFLIEDIAHALSMNCRFNGHTSKFYSVAEHSLLVAAIVYHLGGNNAQIKEALLHDGTEAYLTDVPAPFKQFLPDWKKIDYDLDQKLRTHFGLPSDKTGLVKQADWMALYIEAADLIPDKGQCFLDPENLRVPALVLRDKQNLHPLCLDPETIKGMFLDYYGFITQ